MLHDNIRYYRKKNNLSQEELAEKLGISRQSVSLWETGQAQPTIENILALTKIFDISADALLGSTDNLSEVVSNSPKQAPKSPKRKVAIILACMIAVAVIVGIVIWIVCSGRASHEDVSDKSSTIVDSSAASGDSIAPSDGSFVASEEISTPPNATSSDNKTSSGDAQVSQPQKEFDLFTYCKEFAIKKGYLNGDCSIYQQPAKRYGGYSEEYFSISYWAGSDMVEFCLHCPLSTTYSINFYLRMRGGYDHEYEYLSSRYYRDSGESVRYLSGYIDPAVFSNKYPLPWVTYDGNGGADVQTNFIEESRVGICDLITCLKGFVRVEKMECSFADFEFVNF